MARDTDNSLPVESRDDLVAWIAEGCKSADSVRIGTEHEKIPFYLRDHAPVSYMGDHHRPGVRHLLEGLQQGTGWQPITDGPHLIGLADGNGAGAISLEPGGQLELSGAPVSSLHDTAAELRDHLARTLPLARSLGIGFLSLGAAPTWPRSQVPLMPKSRYAIMSRHMPRVGTLGLDMMLRTASVQVNMDFCDEADMVTKLRVSLALQPLITALFANSPFLDAAPSGMLSTRSHIWTHTDPQRTGMLPFAFERSMGFERYVDYALDVPMYFVKRGEVYYDATGGTFRDLLEGRHPGSSEHPTLGDWENHLSTLFPEVRLKRVLELRGADTVASDLLPALPALVTGILYHRPSLEAAWDLVRDWTTAQRQQLREDAPRLALEASVRGRRLRAVARDVLALAEDGLRSRAHLDSVGLDESVLLDPLREIVESGISRAQYLLARYRDSWDGRLDPLFTENTF
ncbi:glutamate--cysteine ligase [Actinomyces sp. 2119]|uniref:Glutamate--cysteine ligase n=1 Tax=Actinomyces lilanjuaniae TaxID=2321394 RepID=A0ABM6Z3C4_9ACTO|nr:MULTISPECIES: glutamate--cysteine ligase [Actinomyces]AYD89808.1 glutamate--cysteine ligase [Actinomyces lilanjuaniae]RJF44786.1 glutamate--cysteine ligase [Actinomyces sp. 2119]